jgi:hypothetical protein
MNRFLYCTVATEVPTPYGCRKAPWGMQGHLSAILYFCDYHSCHGGDRAQALVTVDASPYFSLPWFHIELYLEPCSLTNITTLP